ncbi:hypothetical protein P4621_26390 [Priestia aryabhattai]|uniref:hypothetical protein n=1 Tax=Bacilli TaxID=91061 RepID=UPI001FF22A06|nr:MULTISPECIES: hypothetical protein [Bacilli]MEC0099591.1 hypothetical protein [Bacillus anthracis]MED3950248.1 hypothetical protein [Priestia aryabhattai]MED4272546.1 hypothetical protein [Weissella confusa]UOX37596.1 hypothetical protein IDM39_04775 [Weissella cibaria]
MKIIKLYADEDIVFNVGESVGFSSRIVSEINEYDEFYEVRYSNSKLVSHINKTYVFRVDLMEED